MFSRKTILFIAGIILCLGLCGGFAFLNTSPNGQSFPKTIEIKQGGLSNITDQLHEAGIIRSKGFFSLIARITGSSSKLKAGGYEFKGPASSLRILERIKDAEYGAASIRVTFPEGFNVFEMGEALEKAGMNFSKEEFVKVARKKEGFLFPDTYEFTSTQTAEEVTQEMQENFVKKIEPLMKEIDTGNRNLADIVKMAAIVEEEAATVADRKKVAGILWKRIEADMALQVCSSFVYVNGKSTWNLTTEDLQIDSPYNTYKYRGLTPTPITNPGLASIEATINYTESPYWYFIADEKGKMYYAKTYAGHQDNIDRYLR